MCPANPASALATVVNPLACGFLVGTLDLTTVDTDPQTIAETPSWLHLSAALMRVTGSASALVDAAN
jgi:hypothetical protein